PDPQMAPGLPRPCLRYSTPCPVRLCVCSLLPQEEFYSLHHRWPRIPTILFRIDIALLPLYWKLLRIYFPAAFLSSLFLLLRKILESEPPYLLPSRPLLAR